MVEEGAQQTTRKQKQDETSVCVAVRVRPLVGSEKVMQCRECIRCDELNATVVLGNKRFFSFDFVHGVQSEQRALYDGSVRPLLDSFLSGYNATIFAYGQTGSGKTFTMGTEAMYSALPEEYGVVPRIIEELFNNIRGESGVEFGVRCSFLEIHNEELRDLLDHSNSNKKLSIRETSSGDIVPYGIVEKEVNSSTDLLTCLEEGSVYRSTGSTLMNAQSSRSHAIFTIYLTQRRTVAQGGTDSVEQTDTGDNASEFICSKFHFVDLAGSERLKKTGSVGARRREGININQGLLALGNCISALGDPARKGQHVPFRDSKITRLLQDSLGGNSKTLMIACVSPADVNFEESLNTMRYAARARNIKNKPIVNRDPNSAKLEMYRTRIKQLEAALNSLGGDVHQLSGDDVNAFPDQDRQSGLSELREENASLDAEVLRLQEVAKAYKLRIDACEALRRNAEQAQKQAELRLSTVIERIDATGDTELSERLLHVDEQDARLDVIKQQQDCIEDLRAKLELQEATVKRLRERKDWQPEEKSEDVLHADSASTEELETLRDIVESTQLREAAVDTESEHDESGDSELEEEQSELESEKHKMDRQFQRANQKHARALRRIDSDIENKSALIERLLKSRQYSHTLRSRYESKIQEMMERMRQTEKQRDKVLENFSESKEHAQHKIEVVKSQYNDKLVALRSELANVKKKFKENEELLRLRPKNELHIQGLRDDIERYKKQRVSLSRQMREEAEKHREWVAEHTRKMKTLQKQSRKDHIQMQKMHHQIRRQDLVMRVKTEKNTVLQRELRQAKRRMADSVKRHPRSSSKRLRQAVRQEIERACKTEELMDQERRLQDQKRELSVSLREAQDALEQRDEDIDEDDVQVLEERYQALREQLDYVNSQELKTSLSEASSSKGAVRSRRPFMAANSQILARLGVQGIDSARVALLAVFEQAVALRTRKEALTRRIDELDSEVNSLQAENESGVSRLEIVRRDSDRRLLNVENERERELQTMLEKALPELGSDKDDAMRDLEKQLTRAKQKQMQLLSPVPPTRRSRRRAKAASAVKPRRPHADGAATGAAAAAAAPPDTGSIARRTRSRRKEAVLNASNAADADKRDILSRLTDKSLFTGTSRFQRRSKHLADVAEQTPAKSRHDDVEHSENTENNAQNSISTSPKPSAAKAWTAIKAIFAQAEKVAK